MSGRAKIDINSPLTESIIDGEFKRQSNDLVIYMLTGSFTALTEVNSLSDIRDFWSNRLPHEDRGEVFIGYSRQHRRNQRQVLNGMSIQTEDTTVTSEGLADGSIPVEGDQIDRGTIIGETEGEGIVLDGNN